MSEQLMLYRREDNIGMVTINRPEKINALTHFMLQRLYSIVEEIRRDDNVRVVILTGNGRTFCAGTDVTGQVPEEATVEILRMKEKNSTEGKEPLWFFNSLPKPVICAINGPAVGVGAELTLHCDIRIASENARWGQIFVLRGLVPDTGAGTYLLPRIVGFSKACELVFSGEIIDAQEMLRIGLISELVPPDQLIIAAKKWASKFLKGAPFAQQMCKQLMYMGLERSMEAHREASRYCFQLSTKTEDFKEGIKSFLEKREPYWIGK
jgi:enoyl-CoA hydratase/carnithine racemase